MEVLAKWLECTEPEKVIKAITRRGHDGYCVGDMLRHKYVGIVYYFNDCLPPSLDAQQRRRVLSLFHEVEYQQEYAVSLLAVNSRRWGERDIGERLDLAIREQMASKGLAHVPEHSRQFDDLSKMYYVVQLFRAVDLIPPGLQSRRQLPDLWNGFVGTARIDTE